MSTDLEDYLTLEQLQAVTVERADVPWVPGMKCHAFVDLAGGEGQDSPVELDMRDVARGISLAGVSAYRSAHRAPSRRRVALRTRAEAPVGSVTLALHHQAMLASLDDFSTLIHQLAREIYDPPVCLPRLSLVGDLEVHRHGVSHPDRPAEIPGPAQ